MKLTKERVEQLVLAINSEIDVLLNGGGSSTHAIDLTEIRNQFETELKRMQAVEITHRKNIPVGCVLHCNVGFDGEEVDYLG